jgi:hypothetical protein
LKLKIKYFVAKTINKEKNEMSKGTVITLVIISCVLLAVASVAL